jgi:hypothetical protein
VIGMKKNILKSLVVIFSCFFFSSSCFADSNQLACPSVNVLRATVASYTASKNSEYEYTVTSDDHNFETNQSWWENFFVVANSEGDAINKVKQNLRWLTFVWGPENKVLGTHCYYHIGIDGVNDVTVSTWAIYT